MWVLATVGAVLLVTGRSIFTWTRQRLLGKVGVAIELQLGDYFVAHLMEMPLSFFERRTPADIASRISDISAIRTAVVGSVLSVVLDVISLSVAAAIMLWYRASVACLVFSMAPPVIIASLLVSRPLVEYERHVRISASQLMGEVIESVIHIKMLKAYGVTSIFANRVKNTYAAFQDFTYKRLCLSSFMTTISLMVAGATSFAVLLIGARLGISGSMRVGELMFFFTMVGIFVASLDRLVPAVTFLQEAFAGIERLSDIMMQPAEDSGAEGTDTVVTSGRIEYKNVSYWHREGFPVLSDVCLTIEPGETIALVGETGSGKSTFACLLAGLYIPRQGEVLVGDRSTRQLDRAHLRQQVTIAFQEPGIVAGTIYDNIVLGSKAYCQVDVESAARDALIHDFIASLPNGYYYDVGANGSTLSSGQRQRIALARALLRDSAILILDEATSNIDPETESAILDAILRRRLGLTTILITHRLSTAARLGKVAVLESGRIRESGTHGVLLDNKGRYYAMWSAMGAHVPTVISS